MLLYHERKVKQHLANAILKAKVHIVLRRPLRPTDLKSTRTAQTKEIPS
jgi:hypothetical protein